MGKVVLITCHRIFDQIDCFVSAGPAPALSQTRSGVFAGLRHAVIRITASTNPARARRIPRVPALRAGIWTFGTGKTKPLHSLSRFPCESPATASIIKKQFVLPFHYQLEF